MLSANFFEAHKETKKEMDKRFKEMNYTTAMKKRMLAEVVGKDAKLGDMTISQMERIIEQLAKEKKRMDNIGATMSEYTPVILMNFEGTLYPVAMTESQTEVLRHLIVGISQETPLNILTKAPVIDAHEVAEKVQKAYAGVRITK